MAAASPSAPLPEAPACTLGMVAHVSIEACAIGLSCQPQRRTQWLLRGRPAQRTPTPEICERKSLVVMPISLLGCEDNSPSIEKIFLGGPTLEGKHVRYVALVRHGDGSLSGGLGACD